MIPHPLTCLSLLYYSTLLYSTRRGTRYLRAPPAVGSSAGRPGSSCPSASARSTISSSRSRSTRWLHTPAAPWLHARPPRRPRPPTRVPTPAPTPEPNPGPNPNQGNTIREFSFLENPRAAALKASTASTTLVAGAGAAAELKRLVASYAETKVRPHRVTAPAT